MDLKTRHRQLNRLVSKQHVISPAVRLSKTFETFFSFCQFKKNDEDVKVRRDVRVCEKVTRAATHEHDEVEEVQRSLCHFLG